LAVCEKEIVRTNPEGNPLGEQRTKNQESRIKNQLDLRNINIKIKTMDTYLKNYVGYNVETELMISFFKERLTESAALKKETRKSFRGLGRAKTILEYKSLGLVQSDNPIINKGFGRIRGVYAVIIQKFIQNNNNHPKPEKTFIYWRGYGKPKAKLPVFT
jgi:hypothetical protein